MIPLYDDNPRSIVPIVTFTLLAVNIVIYLWQIVVPTQVELAYTMIPSAITQGTIPRNMPEPGVSPVWLTIFTSMFMHGSFLHLAGNMLYLWVFGDNIEDDLGHVKFLLFYLVTGVAAAFTHILMSTGNMAYVPTLGASGAIAGVMGGYIVLHSKAGVVSLVPLGPFATLMTVPAWIVLGLWFVYQVVLNSFEMGGASGGGVAYGAHIGGFVAGLILIRVFGPKSRRNRADRFDGVFDDRWR